MDPESPRDGAYRSDIEDKPTFEEVLYWRDHLCSEWGDLDDAMEDEEDLYFQSFDVESPGGRLAVKTGSAPADADAAIDSLVPPDISVHVRPARGRQKYRNQANKLTLFGKAMLYSWRKQKDVLRQIPTDMVIRRVGVFRIMVDRSLWPQKPEGLQASGPAPEKWTDEPEDEFRQRFESWQEFDPEEAWEVRHRRKNPIIFQRRDPRVVRWREADDGELLVVVEHYQTSKVEALHAFSRYDATHDTLRH